MSKPVLVMRYKGWEILADGQTFNGQPSYRVQKFVPHGRGKNKVIVEHHRSCLYSITLAKRWIGRNEALAAGKGKRVPKPKVLHTKGITIKHTCIKPQNKTFARFRFSNKKDSITYVNRGCHNYAQQTYEEIILDHKDKSQNWFDSLPESYTCSICLFTVTKEEIMNTYLVKKIGGTK